MQDGVLFAQMSVKHVIALTIPKTNRIMKKALFGLALLTTLTTVSMAGPAHKEKKAKAKAKSEHCDKASGHACCMKKAQA